MATLNDNTWVADPITREPRFLEAGDVVPSWAADQVGRHLLDDDDTEPTPYRDQKMSDLRVEIDRRNVGRATADKIDPEGHASIDAYASALEADDGSDEDDGDGEGGESSSGAGAGGGDSSGDQSGDGGSAPAAPAPVAPAPAAPAPAAPAKATGTAARPRRSR